MLHSVPVLKRTANVAPLQLIQATIRFEPGKGLLSLAYRFLYAKVFFLWLIDLAQVPLSSA